MCLVRQNENSKGSNNSVVSVQNVPALGSAGSWLCSPPRSSRRMDTLPTSLSSCPAVSWSSQLQAVFPILVFNSHSLLQPLGTKFYCVLLTEKFKETLTSLWYCNFEQDVHDYS